MSGDLVSLRVLVATAVPAQQEPVAEGCRDGVRSDRLCRRHAAASTAMLSRADTDICIVDHGLPQAEKAAVIAAARAARPAPLVFMAAPHGSHRAAEVDGVLAKPATADAARRLVELSARAKIPTRVLIVDDSSTMRSIVRKILSASRFAFDIHEASEGIAALEHLGSGNFGLVFLDYNRPGFTGVETLSEIKRVAPQVSVLMMTSTASDALIQRARAAGALAFLKKPFYPADIDTVIERHYGLHVASAG
jgi:CheY-like chemotaxis protein